jgi:phenylacetate-CoA ligase
MKSASQVIMEIFRKEKMNTFYELSKTQWLSNEKLREIQTEKLRRLFNHCEKHVPYHSEIKSLNKVKSVSDIIKLPFLTKGMINERREDLKARNIPKDYFIPNSTGGSTGQSLNFFSDKRNTMGFGILMRNNMWTGWTMGARQAMLWGSHYDISKANKILNRMKNEFVHKILYLSSYDMREADMIKHRNMINRFKPQLITAYPSGLFIFADFLERNGLKIIKPKGIICSGETLYDYQRSKIESVFGSPVYNRYGCREVGNIAHQCEKQFGLHINSEHVIVEVVDKRGNPCAPGRLGEVVVTDLDNYVFPFIRYRTGDIGILSEKSCDCGRGLPVMEKIEGRVFDIVVGTNGNLLTGNFWTILLRTAVTGIKQFQVIQERQDQLVLKLVTDLSFDDRAKSEIVGKIRSKCGEEMSVDIQCVHDIPLTKSGKHKFIISKVSPFARN